MIRHFWLCCFVLSTSECCTSVAFPAIWYVAPGGIGDGTSAASPLGSIGAAFQFADQGDEIKLAHGTYGAQTIANKTSTDLWTQNVVVSPLDGAIATFTGQLDIFAAHLTLSGLHSSSRIRLRNTADFGRVEGLQTTGWVQISASNVAIVNNHFSSGFGTDAIQIGADGNQRSSNILIEGNYIHDYLNDTTDPNDTIHEDGIQLFDTQNVTIRGNRIFNVSNASIIVSIGQGFGVRDILVENNFLGRTITPNATYGYGTLNLLQADASNVQNFQLINNTIVADVHAANNSQVLFRNNIIDRLQSIGASVSRDHNLIQSRSSGISLGTGDVLGALPAFADAGAGDFHIADSNVVHLAFASEVAAPANDYDGQPRSAPLWVGADQPSVPVLAGDYNDDGTVDAADYTVWRDNLGGSSLLNETESLGIVDQFDYMAWRSNFGTDKVGTGQGPQTVPEPDSLIIGLLAMTLVSTRSGKT